MEYITDIISKLLFNGRKSSRVHGSQVSEFKRTYEHLDRSQLMGENVPHSVLAHFAKNGGGHAGITYR